ncbi:hypothetical protein M2159_004626 [Streptomyces sp. SAI-090]|nr:hypothetical protein [Streptomyces sp. SAI-090]
MVGVPAVALPGTRATTTAKSGRPAATEVLRHATHTGRSREHHAPANSARTHGKPRPRPAGSNPARPAGTQLPRHATRTGRARENLGEHNPPIGTRALAPPATQAATAKPEPPAGTKTLRHATRTGQSRENLGEHNPPIATHTLTPPATQAATPNPGPLTDTQTHPRTPFAARPAPGGPAKAWAMSSQRSASWPWAIRARSLRWARWVTRRQRSRAGPVTQSVAFSGP